MGMRSSTDNEISTTKYHLYTGGIRKYFQSFSSFLSNFVIYLFAKKLRPTRGIIMCKTQNIFTIIIQILKFE